MGQGRAWREAEDVVQADMAGLIPAIHVLLA